MTTRKHGVALVGATGTSGFAHVAQQALLAYEDHPLFEVRALVADSASDVGLPLGELADKTWQLDEAPVPPAWLDTVLAAPDDPTLRDKGVELVVSSLPGAQAKQVDPLLAQAGFPVVSESPAFRLDDDVPLIVPEINADHLPLVRRQRETRGFGDGFLVANPVCTAVVAALPLRALDAAFELRSVILTTLQALSGAGPTGISALQILDNLIPWINQEENKLYTELPKILGQFADGKIVNHPARLAVTATRVNVSHGHTITITAGLGRQVTLDEVAQVLADFRGRAQELQLPLSPADPIDVTTLDNRPQPRLDREKGDGRVVTVGRIREHLAVDNGVGLVALGHNQKRGTYGNTLPLAELLVAEGYLEDRA